MGSVFIRLIFGAAIALTVVPAAFANPAGGTANAAGAAGLVTLDDVGTGSLLLKSDIPGRYVRAPLVSSSFDIDISGPVVRATLSQRFINPSEQWVEGRYAFPLPDEFAVDGLKMRIGDRFIEGEIKEKQEARETYERAKAEGRKAALVEQHRPNLFTNDVANIGPGDVVVVQITWLQTLAPEAGAWEMRLPLVVAPRYNPNPIVQTVDFGPNGWAISDPVPDRDRIESPLIDPRTQDPETIHNPVTISIDLDAGFPLDLVESRHHTVEVGRPADTRAEIELSGPVAADRDFILRWTAAVDGVPHAALFRESFQGRDYYLAMLTPSEADDVTDRGPREVIFVQDVSGSMDGESIRQAREGLALALKRLRPEDRFNLILFNDQYWTFANDPVPATPENMRRALATAARMEAGGGTEMLPALKEALIDRGSDNGPLRQIVFLTDGAVGNEAQMLEAISTGLGRSRLFTVGIGSAPNSYFMTRAAELGRGSTVYVDDLTKVAGQMAGLFAKLETPVLTDVAAVLPDGAADISPNPLPDLYAGDPVVFAFHAPEGDAGQLRLVANRAGGSFTWQIDLARAAEREGVAKLWARKHIRALEALAYSQIGWEMGQEALEAQILATALNHGLVSRLTSLVAVDATPSRPADAPLGTAKVPLNLPAGWNPGVFLDKAAPAPQPAMKRAALPQAQIARLQTSAPAAEAEAAAPPRGSLNWRRQFWAGIALIVLALAGWLLTRRRDPAGAE
ncbi:MAG: marine proteobacterial sortase target protein [Minwuia sp.]|uniref:marine proteobacterial sortase target protein n=1 Tax=Minwuia sp. TaxID=2493630 RepID=UPI003A8906DE